MKSNSAWRTPPDKNEVKWEMQYFELKKFLKKFGHCDVSITHKGYRKLYHWVGFQRKRRKFKPGNYEPERIRKLDDMGFCWNILERMFEQKFRQLEKYKNKHGHCNVSEFENRALAKWCGKLRIERRQGVSWLTKQRKRRLDKLGFDWESHLEEEHEKAWLEHFAELKKFKKKYGHCDVPESYKNYTLHRWCLTQRTQRKNGNHLLKRDRVNKLETLGFSWDMRDKWFNQHVEKLEKYKKKHGHCHVRVKNDPRLAAWCFKIRTDRRLNSSYLSPERIKRLTKLGFPWVPPAQKIYESAWMKHYDELKKFIRVHKRFPTWSEYKYNHLNEWIRVQKLKFHRKEKSLTPERIRKLNALKIDWGSVDKNGQLVRAQIDNEVYLEELRRLQKQLGRTPSQKDIINYGKYSYTVYFYHFGSLLKARTMAGLEKEVVRKKRKPTFSDEEILNDLRRVASKIGRAPILQDLEEYGKYNHKTYSLRFGSLGKARIKAGLSKQEKIPRTPFISNDELLSEIRKVAKRLRKVPGIQEMDKYGKYGKTTYHSRFGGMTKAIALAGLEK